MIVGLTGGIGSGKSTVSNEFKALSIDVVDADIVAREVVAPGSEALESIHKKFGDSVMLDGALNRAHLRALIFQDGTAKTWLEELLHPLIRNHIFEQLKQATSKYKILEAPLLFENNLHGECSKSILVDVPESLQVERTAKRDASSVEQIESIIQAQMSRDNKLKMADYVLDNSGDLAQLKPQILRLDQVLRLLAENPEFQ